MNCFVKGNSFSSPLGRIIACPVTIAIAGAQGGRTLDFLDSRASGITLLGMTSSRSKALIKFMSDLSGNIGLGDSDYLIGLNTVNTYLSQNSLDLPRDGGAWDIGSYPASVTDPIIKLDLMQAGIS